jgi:hypothetical protein
MKHVWSDYQVKVSRRPAIWGLYRRIGLWRRKLVCYFLERENARDTAKSLGRGFGVSKMPLRASYMPAAESSHLYPLTVFWGHGL